MRKDRENPIKSENPQTIYRDKTGKIIDPTQTKEIKIKELEKLNYENVIKYLIKNSVYFSFIGIYFEFYINFIKKFRSSRI